MKKVYIIGGAQSDFATNWSRNNKEIGDVMEDSFLLALDNCAIDPNDIDSVHIGNFVGELFCGQGQLGGVLCEHIPQLSGLPIQRHEAACASGSMAALSAMRDITSGDCDLAAVHGVELMRNVDGKTASHHLGAAAWVGHEAESALYPWVYLFSQIKEKYQAIYGLQDEHLAILSKKNYNNAKLNPNAQSRNWTLREEEYTNDDTHNPIVEGTLRKSDCGRISDGSATVFLASERYATRYAQKRNIGLAHIPYIKGWGHRTGPISLQSKIKGVDPQGYLFPHLHLTIQDALHRAGISKSSDLDAIETHDCFTISEYLAIEHFGLTAPGQGWQAIEDGRTQSNGSIPMNTSGGLIGAGHPVGATGVRMLLDAYKQVSDKAGSYQVEGAQNVGVLNIGGSFTTTASFIIGR